MDYPYNNDGGLLTFILVSSRIIDYSIVHLRLLLGIMCRRTIPLNNGSSRGGLALLCASSSGVENQLTI